MPISDARKMSLTKVEDNTSRLSQSCQKLMFFDLAIGGHHASYIKYLTQHWADQELAEKIFFVVSPEFLKKHADVIDLACYSIEFVSISDEENKQLKSTKNVIRRAFLEWDIFCKYAKNLNADRGFLLYFDHLQLPIVFGKPSPCLFSGIYFRPTFHYSEFEEHSNTLKGKIRGWRQKKLLSCVLKNRNILGVLSLDSYAVKTIQKIAPKDKKIYHLADPVYAPLMSKPAIEKFRETIGIEKNRKIFLLFGRLTNRKGINQVVEAFKELDQEAAEKSCLLLIGEIPQSIKETINHDLIFLSENSKLQLIVKDEFQKEKNIPLFFSLADVVLTPYQKHVGMSGIFLLAEAYRKEIISSNYGLLGKLARDSALGITLNTESSSEIAKCIKFILKETDNDDERISLGSKFPIEEHTPEKFSDLIFSVLLNSEIKN